MTTERQHSLASEAELLARLDKPDLVVHIGAGTGTGDMHRWRNWDVGAAILVDSDERRLKRAFQRTPRGWRVEAALVSSEPTAAEYFEASNPAESGLLDPRELATLWPALRTVSTSTRPATTVDSLVGPSSEAQLTAKGSLWLIVDCLPAASILHGSEQTLGRAAVVWARALLSAGAVGSGASLADIENALAPFGYRRAFVAEGNHPDIGEVIFCRDWRSWYGPRLLEQQNLHAELSAQSQRAQALATRERVELAQRLEAQAAAIQRDQQEHARWAATLQGTIDELRELKASDESAARAKLEELGRLVADRQQRVDELTADKHALERSRDELLLARDAQEKLLADHASQLTRALLTAQESAARVAGLAAQTETLQTEIASLLARTKEESEEHARVLGEQQQRLDELSSDKNALENSRDELMRARDAQARLAEHHAKELEAAIRAKEEVSAEAARLQAQMTELIAEHTSSEQAAAANLETQAKIEAVRQRRIDELAAENAQLEKSRHAERQAAEQQSAQLAAANRAHDASASLAARLQVEIDKLTAEKADGEKLAQDLQAQTRLGAERQRRIDELAAEKVQLEKSRDESIRAQDAQREIAEEQTARLVTASRAKEDSAALVAKLQAQIDQLVEEKASSSKSAAEAVDAQAKLATERQGRIDALSSENAKLEQALHDATAGRDAQAKLAEERQGNLIEVQRAGKAQTTLLRQQQDQLQALRVETEALHKQREELTTVRDSLNKSQSELIKKHDEQRKLATQRQARIEALGAEKTALEKTRDELVAARNALADEKVQLARDLDTQKKSALERHTLLTLANKARDEHSALVSKRDAALAAIREELAAAEQRHAESAAAHQPVSEKNAELTQALHSQARMLHESQTKLQAALATGKGYSMAAAAAKTRVAELIKEREQLQQKLLELGALVEALRSEKSALIRTRNADLENAKKKQSVLETQIVELTANATAVNPRDSTIESLRFELKDQAARELLLRRELVRAQAQINLVTDLLAKGVRI